MIPKDFFNVFFFDMITKFLGLIIMILFIRVLSKELYAEYTMFISFSSFLFGIFGSGLSLSYIRYTTEKYSRNNSVSKKLYYFILLLPLPIFIFIIPLTKEIGNLLNLNYFLIFLSIIYAFLLYMVRINQSHFQSLENYTNSGLIDSIKNIFIIVLVIISYFLLDKVVTSYLFYIYLISTIIVFLISFRKIRDSFKNNCEENNNEIKKLLSESGWLILYGIFLNLFNQLDTLMISYFLDSESIANYGVSYKYYMLFLSLLPAIQTVLRVRTSKKEIVDNIDVQKDFTKNWIKKVTPISLIIVVLLIANSFWFLPLLNGKQYTESISSFNILAVGLGLSYIFAPNVGVLMSSKKYNLLCLYALIGLIINYLGNLLLIPKYGINFAALTTVLSQAIVNILSTLTVLQQKSLQKSNL